MPQVTLDLTCHCGQIRYEFDGYVLGHRICHCGDCKKTTGGPFSEKIRVMREMVEPTDGILKMYRFEREDGKGHTRVWRCDECSCPILEDTEKHPEQKCIWLLQHKLHRPVAPESPPAPVQRTVSPTLARWEHNIALSPFGEPEPSTF
ncbi:Mss4-like protein [Xylariaceae sp. FL0662B]|nr:Mss4-like protein [Xylariaceae sp. FL0662B]